jgi:signal transduction histidine kinase
MHGNPMRGLMRANLSMPNGNWLRRLRPLICLACGLAFIADLTRRDGDLLAFGVFYIPLVCTAVLNRSRRSVWWLAAISIAMVVLGAFFPDINADYYDLIVNRSLSIAAIVVTALLVSHAGRVRECLVEQTQRAHAAERVKTEIFTNLGYDLRQPLHAIIGLTRLMGADCRADQREPLGHVQIASRRLLATINNLVDLTIFDERVPRLGPIDLTALLSRAVDDVRQHATEAKVAVVTEIVPPPSPLTGDAWAVRRIVENILDNAVKFTPPGGSVRLSTIPSAGDVVITVTDTGEGIPEDLLAQIGQPFLQGDLGIVGRADGTGTGLALSLRLARSIGAELRLRSGPGLGTSATLRLPRRAEVRPEHAQAVDVPAAS